MTTMVETLVVSTAVSQPSTTFKIPSQAITIFVSKSQTKTPSPTKVYTRKRKFKVHGDDILAPTPISSTPFIQTNPEPIIPPPSPPPPNLLVDPKVLEGHDPSRTVPLAADYPLELHVVKNEIKQFYTVDDPTKRKFPSLHGFRPPKNLDEYLKRKAKQAEIQAIYEGKRVG
ncbi:hypothetical protein Hanom_Chr06g00542731 [Helianthus anomalus]